MSAAHSAMVRTIWTLINSFKSVVQLCQTVRQTEVSKFCMLPLCKQNILQKCAWCRCKCHVVLDQSRGADVSPDSLSPLCHIMLQPLCSFFIATIVMLICGRCFFESTPLQQQMVSCQAHIFVDRQALHMLPLSCFSWWRRNPHSSDIRACKSTAACSE